MAERASAAFPVAKSAREEDAEVLALGQRCLALSKRIRLIAKATPRNIEDEIRRLILLRNADRRDEPAFLYEPRGDAADVNAELGEIAAACVSRWGDAHWLSMRAAELWLEARLAESVGTDSFVKLARERYRSNTTEDERAKRWANSNCPSVDNYEQPTSLSDDENDPHSLLCEMRRAVGENKLPVRVITHASLSALAATGEGVVLIARGRRLPARDVARTVLHEIQGHVIPYLKRQSGSMETKLRPAADADREEGSALALERAHGFLDDFRKKELGMRHAAACLAHEGAPFHDICDRLLAHDADIAHAVRIAARALRGGGLGRERVYLPALWNGAA